MGKEKPSSLAIASLVTGICSLIPLVGIVPGIAALICSITDLVRTRSKKSGSKGKAFDITGIILGLISIVLFFLLYLIIILLIFNR